MAWHSAWLTRIRTLLLSRISSSRSFQKRFAWWVSCGDFQVAWQLVKPKPCLTLQTNNPIYNLLPDLLSNLSNEESINEHQFRSIMRSLISLIDKEKQGEQLVRKICGRICESVAKEDMQMSRSLAYCISQLPLGERGFRRCAHILLHFSRSANN